MIGAVARRVSQMAVCHRVVITALLQWVIYSRKGISYRSRV